jgi:hypothetical protein
MAKDASADLGAWRAAASKQLDGAAAKKLAELYGFELGDDFLHV